MVTGILATRGVMTLSWKIVIDCADPHAQAAFWSAALGYTVEDNSVLIEQLLAAGHIGQSMITTGSGPTASFPAGPRAQDSQEPTAPGSARWGREPARRGRPAVRTGRDGTPGGQGARDRARRDVRSRGQRVLRPVSSQASSTGHDRPAANKSWEPPPITGGRRPATPGCHRPHPADSGQTRLSVTPRAARRAARC